MSHTEYTPGPWKVRPYETFGGQGFNIDAPEAMRLAVAQDITLSADARLIASAPELYEALLLCVIRDPSLTANAMVMDALAKAEGR